MRLIDGDALILHLTICQQNVMPTSKFYAIDDVIHYVKTMPTIEPERKTGKWESYIISMFDGEGCRCSECGFEGVPYWDFCPNCGADMRGEQDEID